MPALICSQHGTCECDPRNYIQRSGTCYGRIYALCSSGTDLKCHGNVTCDNGYCGGEQPFEELHLIVKAKLHFETLTRAHLHQLCNYHLWSPLMEPYIEAQNTKKCSNKYDKLQYFEMLQSAEARIKLYSEAHGYFKNDTVKYRSLCGLRPDVWGDAESSTCICSKYYFTEEDGLCKAQRYAPCSTFQPCAKDFMCLPAIAEAILFNLTEGGYVLTRPHVTFRVPRRTWS